MLYVAVCEGIELISKATEELLVAFTFQQHASEPRDGSAQLHVLPQLRQKLQIKLSVPHSHNMPTQPLDQQGGRRQEFAHNSLCNSLPVCRNKTHN